MNAIEREIERRKRILEHAEKTGNVSRACRYFGIARSGFYRWRDAYLKGGDEGLAPKKSGPRHHPHETPREVVEKVLYLRKKYHLGPRRIVWY